MNDLTFGATLLSLLLMLSAAVYSEATGRPSKPTGASATTMAHANPASVRVAGANSSACACNDVPPSAAAR